MSSPNSRKRKAGDENAPELKPSLSPEGIHDPSLLPWKKQSKTEPRRRTGENDSSSDAVLCNDADLYYDIPYEFLNLFLETNPHIANHAHFTFSDDAKLSLESKRHSQEYSSSSSSEPQPKRHRREYSSSLPIEHKSKPCRREFPSSSSSGKNSPAKSPSKPCPPASKSPPKGETATANPPSPNPVLVPSPGNQSNIAGPRQSNRTFHDNPSGTQNTDSSNDNHVGAPATSTMGQSGLAAGDNGGLAITDNSAVPVAPPVQSYPGMGVGSSQHLAGMAQGVARMDMRASPNFAGTSQGRMDMRASPHFTSMAQGATPIVMLVPQHFAGMAQSAPRMDISQIGQGLSQSDNRAGAAWSSNLPQLGFYSSSGHGTTQFAAQSHNSDALAHGMRNAPNNHLQGATSHPNLQGGTNLRPSDSFTTLETPPTSVSHLSGAIPDVVRGMGFETVGEMPLSGQLDENGFPHHYALREFFSVDIIFTRRGPPTHEGMTQSFISHRHDGVVVRLVQSADRSCFIVQVKFNFNKFDLERLRSSRALFQPRQK